MILNCDCVSVCVCSFRWAGWADVSVFPQVSTFLWWQSIWNLSEDSGCKTGIPTSSGFLCQVRCGHHAGDQTHNPAIGLPMLVFIVNHRSGCECYLGRTGHLVGRLAVSFLVSMSRCPVMLLSEWKQKETLHECVYSGKHLYSETLLRTQTLWKQL